MQSVLQLSDAIICNSPVLITEPIVWLQAEVLITLCMIQQHGTYILCTRFFY